MSAPKGIKVTGTLKKVRDLKQRVELLQSYAYECEQAAGKKGMKNFHLCEKLSDLEGTLNDAANMLRDAIEILETM